MESDTPKRSFWTKTLGIWRYGSSYISCTHPKDRRTDCYYPHCKCMGVRRTTLEEALRYKASYKKDPLDESC